MTNTTATQAIYAEDAPESVRRYLVAYVEHDSDEYEVRVFATANEAETWVREYISSYISSVTGGDIEGGTDLFELMSEHGKHIRLFIVFPDFDESQQWFLSLESPRPVESA